MTGVLDGLTIVEGSAYVAAPLGGMTLAQLGADVIRFDDIGGGLDHTRWPLAQNGQSLFWAGLNKGKRSLRVNLRSDEGRELVSQVIASAGAFLTNFPARGWLSYETLHARREDLIMVHLKGNRDGSSEVDYTVNPATGFPWATGPRNLTEPLNSVLPAWDIAMGELAAVGLLAADRHRSRTGRGQLVETALSDVAFAVTGHLGRVAQAQLDATDSPRRDGNYLYGAFGHDFVTRDERHVMVVALTDRQWRSLLDVTDTHQQMTKINEATGVDLDTESGRYEDRDLIAAILRPWFESRKLSEIRAAFEGTGVSWGIYQTFRQLVDDDPRVATEMWEDVEHPGVGTYRMPGTPLDFSAIPRQPVRRAPLLGEHTEEILTGMLGLPQAEIGRLLEAGIPESWKSGIYALRISSSDAEDLIPFAVRPRRGAPTANILFLMPTFTYLAYGSEQTLTHEPDSVASGIEYPIQPQDVYIVENGLKSLYDRHSDESGVCYSSRRRPLLNMRPKYNCPWLADGKGSPYLFNADLHLVDWLIEHGYAFDVVADEDLHREGRELLEAYNVVLTGTHPEYWSLQMIRATQDYLAGGGRLMYMGGNGMYWVTEPCGEGDSIVEVRRRGPATTPWEPAPGEAHSEATGELGGIWRYRGMDPSTWLGVGFAAQGWSVGRPYERSPGSFDSRTAFIFEGIGDDEPSGDFPALVNGYGAAGYEIDRADPSIGTPGRTIELASAGGFSNDYQLVSEDVLEPSPHCGGEDEPRVSAEMTLLEYPNDGAVFSTGSIQWSSCLSFNGYQNNVSRITKNVLDAVARDEPLPGG